MNKLLKLVDYSNPNSLGSKFRKRRSKVLAKLIETASAENGAVRIIDLGGTEAYWEIFSPEFLSQHVHSILLINHDAGVTQNTDLFELQVGDACNLNWLEDGSFDIVHSNSVIEHLGDWANMCRFAGEVKRLAHRYYVQTPYLWFPIEPHFIAPFFHWLPEASRAGILRRIALGNFAKSQDIDDAMKSVQSVRLLDGSQFRYLFGDADHVSEKYLGLTKSLIAIRT